MKHSLLPHITPHIVITTLVRCIDSILVFWTTNTLEVSRFIRSINKLIVANPYAEDKVTSRE